MFFFTFTNEGSHVINERMDVLIEQMKPDDVTKEITDKFVKIKDKVEGFFDKNADKIKNYFKENTTKIKTYLKQAGYKIKDLTADLVGKIENWLD